jgi:hypothetical protein
MKHGPAALGLILALAVAACASGPVVPSATPVSSATELPMAPSETPTVAPPTAVPTAPMVEPTEEAGPPQPISRSLHATDPKLVKLASGDMPTFVEFFAFW